MQENTDQKNTEYGHFSHSVGQEDKNSHPGGDFKNIWWKIIQNI